MPKVTVHKCAETIQGRKLFKGGNYRRKYGRFTVKTTSLIEAPTNIWQQQTKV